jgi:hypothetical protein
MWIVSFYFKTAFLSYTQELNIEIFIVCIQIYYKFDQLIVGVRLIKIINSIRTLTNKFYKIWVFFSYPSSPRIKVMWMKHHLQVKMLTFFSLSGKYFEWNTLWVSNWKMKNEKWDFNLYNCRVCVVGQYYVIATPDSGGWDGDSWDLCGHLPLHKLFEIFFLEF